MTILGTDEQGKPVEISIYDRSSSMYVIGKTGTGKSTLIENMLVQDIESGLGICLIEPHRDLTEHVINRCNWDRVNRGDVILLDPLDDESFGLNIYECPDISDPKTVAYTLGIVMDTFEKLYDMSRSTPRMAQVMRNVALLLIYNPGMTILEIPNVLSNKNFREKLIRNMPSHLHQFWARYESLRPSEQFDLTESSVNKIDEFINDPIGRTIFGQSKTSINFRDVMDRGKVLLISLSTDFPMTTSLLGSILISQLLMAALSRKDIPEKSRRHFSLFIDEFQNFATPSVNKLLTESRKYHLSSCVAHQTRNQVSEVIRSTTLNVGSLVCFRLTSEDAEELAPSFDLTPQPGDPIERPVRVYKQEVVQHLLEKGHVSKEANDYVDELLRPMQEVLEQLKDKVARTAMSGRLLKNFGLFIDNSTYYSFASHLRTGMTKVNYILVRAMEGKLSIGSQQFQSLVCDAIITLRGYLEVQAGVEDQDEEKIPLPEELPLFVADLVRVESGANYDNPSQEEQDQYKRAVREIKARHMKYLHGLLNPISIQRNNYSDEFIDRSVRMRASEELGGVTGFWTWVYLLSEELAKEPIMVDSGKYETVEGPRQSYSDRANQVANELVQLPKFHARIKIPKGEYLIETISPSEMDQDRSAGQPRDEEQIKNRRQDNKRKKQQIIEHTRKNYCKSRSEVEEEIRRRQEPPEPPTTRKYTL